MGDVLGAMRYMTDREKDQYIRALTGQGRGLDLGGRFNNAIDGLGDAAKFTEANITPIMQGAQGLLGIGMNLFGNSGVYNDEIGNRMGVDIYGRPIYSYQNYQESIESLKEERKGQVGESVVSGLGSGAQAGAAIGSIVPGVGTAIGAGLGAVVGSVAGFIGGKKRDREMKSEIANREMKLKDSTIMFNQNNENFFSGAQADSVQSYLLNQRARRIG